MLDDVTGVREEAGVDLRLREVDDRVVRGAALALVSGPVQHLELDEVDVHGAGVGREVQEPPPLAVAEPHHPVDLVVEVLGGDEEDAVPGRIPPQ